MCVCVCICRCCLYQPHDRSEEAEDLTHHEARRATARAIMFILAFVCVRTHDGGGNYSNCLKYSSHMVKLMEVLRSSRSLIKSGLKPLKLLHI